MTSKTTHFLNLFFGSKIKRYEAKHKLLCFLAKYIDVRVGNINMSWHKDQQFIEAYGRVREQKHKKDIPERKFVLHSIANSIKHIPGDIAECGVYIGESSFLMLDAMKDTDKKIFGFDSFEGLSQPGKFDKVTNKHSFKWEQSDLSVPEQMARNNLKPFEGRYAIYKGWIPERFHEVEDKEFCLVHIDVDLYQPTLKSIEFFWEKLNTGGALVCDDYGSEACPGARKAMDEFFNERKLSVIHLTTGQGMVFKSA